MWLRRRRLKAADANPDLTVTVHILLDQETAPALRARKKSRPIIHVRHVEYLTEQVPLIRFLEGQEPLTAGSTTAKHLNLDLPLRSIARRRRGTHGGPLVTGADGLRKPFTTHRSNAAREARLESGRRRLQSRA